MSYGIVGIHVYKYMYTYIEICIYIYIYWQLHTGRTLFWTFLVPFSHFGVIDFIVELSYAEWFQALNMRTFLVYVHVF